MLMHKFKYSIFIIIVSACNSFAQSGKKEINDPNHLQQQIKDLQQQIDLLKDSVESQGTLLSPGYTTNTNQTFQPFNPETSVIGDVLFHAGRNEEDEHQNQFNFREMELAFGSPVDPYGRADFFLGIEKEDGDWHTHLEEGYFTFDTLPFDLKARVGKFYSAFGKVNQYHTHAMPWVDKPLMIRNFFGEEGMSEAGAELSWLLPNPWDNYMELIFQAQNNGNEASFAGDRSNNLMYVTHMKNFFDIDNDSSIELGGSFATGSNAATGGDHRTNLEGIDLTYKWRPAEKGLYKSLTCMNELMFSQKEQGSDKTVHSHGLYSSLEYQFDRRWSVFGRYDYSKFPDYSSSHENGYSAGLTFHQSEYCFLRLQYEHTESSGGFTGTENRDEIMLQFNFGIGPHRAHQY